MAKIKKYVAYYISTVASLVFFVIILLMCALLDLAVIILAPFVAFWMWLNDVPIESIMERTSRAFVFGLVGDILKEYWGENDNAKRD